MRFDEIFPSEWNYVAAIIDEQNFKKYLLYLECLVVLVLFGNKQASSAFSLHFVYFPLRVRYLLA